MTTLKARLVPLVPLVLVLKQLLVSNGLNDPYTGGLGSHALTLMVAHSLQIEQHKSCELFGDLLLTTLDFYANRFNPATDAVCPSATDDAQPTAEIQPGNLAPCLPHAFVLKYVLHADAAPAPLYVYDPERVSMNVAASTFRFEAVQKLFTQAHADISSHYLCEPISSSHTNNLIQIVTRKEKYSTCLP